MRNGHWFHITNNTNPPIRECFLLTCMAQCGFQDASSGGLILNATMRNTISSQNYHILDSHKNSKRQFKTLKFLINKNWLSFKRKLEVQYIQMETKLPWGMTDNWLNSYRSWLKASSFGIVFITINVTPMEIKNNNSNNNSKSTLNHMMAIVQPMCIKGKEASATTWTRRTVLLKKRADQKLTTFLH